jgi:hypothetical protein
MKISSQLANNFAYCSAELENFESRNSNFEILLGELCVSVVVRLAALVAAQPRCGPVVTMNSDALGYSSLRKRVLDFKYHRLQNSANIGLCEKESRA